MTRRTTALAAAMLLLAAAPPGLSATSSEELCLAAKLGAGGKYVACLLAADAGFAKTLRGPADAQDRVARLDKCFYAFRKGFLGAESKFGANCGMASSLVVTDSNLEVCRSGAAAAIGSATTFSSPPGGAQSA